MAAATPSATAPTHVYGLSSYYCSAVAVATMAASLTMAETAAAVVPTMDAAA